LTETFQRSPEIGESFARNLIAMRERERGEREREREREREA
jgi:hypothetical protein